MSGLEGVPVRTMGVAEGALPPAGDGVAGAGALGVVATGRAAMDCKWASTRAMCSLLALT